MILRNHFVVSSSHGQVDAQCACAVSAFAAQKSLSQESCSQLEKINETIALTKSVSLPRNGTSHKGAQHHIVGVIKEEEADEEGKRR